MKEREGERERAFQSSYILIFSREVNDSLQVNKLYLFKNYMYIMHLFCLKQKLRT